jgi:hypothetical protein
MEGPAVFANIKENKVCSSTIAHSMENFINTVQDSVVKAVLGW